MHGVQETTNSCKKSFGIVSIMFITTMTTGHNLLQSCTEKHLCPTSSSDASVSTTIGNWSSQPSTLNVIVNSPSQPSTSNVTINSSPQPSTSNITVNLSSQQSTSPLESETLLDQVARVIAQDCEENRACMRADWMTHHKTSLKYPMTCCSRF